MIRNIMFLFLAFAALSIQSCGAQASANTPSPEASVKVATNVSIGTCSVMAYYRNAEFVFNYDGSAYTEIDGKINTFAAHVCQESPGVWIAEPAEGELIRIYATTGTTNYFRGGEFRCFSKE